MYDCIPLSSEKTHVIATNTEPALKTNALLGSYQAPVINPASRLIVGGASPDPRSGFSCDSTAHRPPYPSHLGVIYVRSIDSFDKNFCP